MATHFLRTYFKGKCMKTYTAEELKEILELHVRWLNGEVGGLGADLESANLRECKLRECKLKGCKLRECKRKFTPRKIITNRNILHYIHGRYHSNRLSTSHY